MVVAVWGVVVVVSVVPGGSSVTVPMTQYDLVGSRSGQVMPGFSAWKSLTDSPHVPAKLSHVAPLPGVVSKRQSTSWRNKADASAGMSPPATRWISCIIVNAKVVA
ncbi:hypothetical protein BJX63DRAFT_380757 [Aspergillus granulosus]|uniref:Secreted protein n=1 Tax=Aspergillus granulosus TaxID=176169 RepID=A0ABR4I094_9EURO